MCWAIVNSKAHVWLHCVSRPEVCCSAKDLSLSSLGNHSVTHFIVQHWSSSVCDLHMDGWQRDIFGGAPTSAAPLSPFQCSRCVLHVHVRTQGNFYNESVIVLAPDSVVGRNLCRLLTLLSPILVVSTSARHLGGNKQEAQAIGLLLPSPLWRWRIPQLAKRCQVCSVNVALTLTEQLSHSPMTYGVN